MSDFRHWSHDLKAVKPYVCWYCGKPIKRGDRYSRHKGQFEGKSFSFPVHNMHRTEDGNGTDCNLAFETLDQNPELRPRVFWPTIESEKEPTE